jgi:lipopolysaccharide export system permease protein
MLKRIDRYIIKKFLSTFFFMLGLIMLFSVVFDISEKLSEFISNKAPLHEIFFSYYVTFILYYGNTFSSMIIFLSVIWFTGKMAQNTEIIPIWFSGRPVTRFLRPYFIGATILTIMSLVLNHVIIPRTNKIRLAFEERYYRDILTVNNYQAEYPGNELVYFSNYAAEEQRVNDLTIQKWSKDNKPIYFLRARFAKNKPGTNEWQLTDYYEKNYEFPKAKLIHGRHKDTTFVYRIEEMAQRDNAAQALTFTELKNAIEREKLKGSKLVPDFEIELHQRTAFPFATYILTLIGVSVASQKKRGGIGMNIAIGLAFIFVYIFRHEDAYCGCCESWFPYAVVSLVTQFAVCNYCACVLSALPKISPHFPKVNCRPSSAAPTFGCTVRASNRCWSASS